MTAPIPVVDLPAEKRQTGLTAARADEVRFRVNVIVGGALFVLALSLLAVGVAVTS